MGAVSHEREANDSIHVKIQVRENSRLQETKVYSGMSVQIGS